MTITARDIIITEEGAQARGRNGYFVPKEVELEAEADGIITLRVYSKSRGEAAPISLSLDLKDWQRISEALCGVRPRGPVDHFEPGDKVIVKGTDKILTIENYFGPQFYPPYTVKEEPNLYAAEDFVMVKE